MKTLKLFISTAVTTLLVLAAFTIQAQNTATVQATATVLDPVTIINSSGMHFGDEILPGISHSISRKDAEAAKFTLVGVGGNYVSINFTLPDVLVHETSGDEMPIIFSPTDAEKADSEDGSSNLGVFDPGQSVNHPISGTGSDLFIWLGGTINPRGDQAAGNYSGDITIEVAYTEN